MFGNSAGKFGAPLQTKIRLVSPEAHQKKNASCFGWSWENPQVFRCPPEKIRKFFWMVMGKSPQVVWDHVRKFRLVFLDGREKNSASFFRTDTRTRRQVLLGGVENATSLLWIGPHRVGKYFRHILSRPQASSLITVSIFVVTNVSWCRRIIIKGLLLYCLSIRKFGKSRMRIKHVTNSDYHKPDDSSLFRQYMSNYQ